MGESAGKLPIEAHRWLMAGLFPGWIVLEKDSSAAYVHFGPKWRIQGAAEDKQTARR
jgi:hypothetical protein